MSLELTSIRFAYPRQPRPVLDNFSLRVERGESVAIMAPSGVGKSTALSIAGLLLKPQAGHVTLNGENVTVRDAPRLRGTRISQIFQAASLLPRRTVLDNIMLPMLINGCSRADAEPAATSLAAGLGIDELIGRRAGELSGGQAQRVGIARALVTCPDLVIADEPTANLDRRTAAEVAKVLFGVRRAGSILLVATHDPAVAALADRTVQLGADQPVASR